MYNTSNTMIEEMISQGGSNKFPPVVVTNPILGLNVGDKLVFDFASGKYLSIEESEDISADNYYYSGYAIAIDPFVVRDNIGEFFAYYTFAGEDKVAVGEVKSAADELKADELKEEEAKNIVEEIKVDEDKVDETTESTSDKVSDKPSKYLLLKCNLCDNITNIGPIDSDGISIFLSEENFVTTVCGHCGNSMKLFVSNDASGENSEESNPEG